LNPNSDKNTSPCFRGFNSLRTSSLFCLMVATIVIFLWSSCSARDKLCNNCLLWHPFQSHRLIQLVSRLHSLLSPSVRAVCGFSTTVLNGIIPVCVGKQLYYSNDCLHTLYKIHFDMWN
jgi:hypothetical protein